ncbi:MAG TPA: leucyl aminopeptidase family protein [Caulobacteraceae bacterium]|jgi:leucyl aminopeptidase
MHDVLIDASDTAVPVRLLFDDEMAGLDARGVAWAEASEFKAQAGRLLMLTDDAGRPERVLFGLGSRAAFDPMTLRGLPTRLPRGDYALENAGERPAELALAWALGSHLFDRYKARPERGRARLVLPQGVDAAAVRHLAAACALVREMVDTAPADMGPLQIETIAREIAAEASAEITVTTGDALLEANYPAVHAVGRAAAAHRQPRLIEIGWRLDRADLPLVALVGKGVCFDSGGLDIKGAAGMRHMKKDMGGAAHALALGRLVMQSDLPVRLVVLIPAVENAISADAFRPGDVLKSRKGLTIEVGNTDAEGRVILSDALARAGEHAPELTLDFATLTGAARVALGPEVPPFYTDDPALADDLARASVEAFDPLWRMPLWRGYREAVESEIADLRNDSADWAQGGSICAALFLQRFAPESGAWAHFDVMAWNPRTRPGWPMGGEAQGLRAAFAMLLRRYGQASR